jgi:hypothetical protein
MNKLFRHWENQGIPIAAGCSHLDIRAREAELGISLPKDIRDFYSFANGMAEFYPNFSDEEGFSFWPLDALDFTAKLFPNGCHPELKRCLIFADSQHGSWWFGFLLDDSRNGYSIVIIPHSGTFKKIANSFLEFLELYYRNDDLLFDVNLEA